MTTDRRAPSSPNGGDTMTTDRKLDTGEAR